ncbi:unnamed protein product [Boreogadus saida]
MTGQSPSPDRFLVRRRRPCLDISPRQAIRGREQELGFTLTPQRSRPFPAAVLTDLGYAEDINLIHESQELLIRVETEWAKDPLRDPGGVATQLPPEGSVVPDDPITRHIVLQVSRDPAPPDRQLNPSRSDNRRAKAQSGVSAGAREPPGEPRGGPPPSPATTGARGRY